MRVGWKLPAVAAALVALLVAAAIAVRGLDVEVWSEAAKSFGYRVQYWQATMGVIGHRPWLGCGPGQFRDAYTAYKLPEASEEVADPHNFLLEVWATAGTPALLALLAVLACYAAALRSQSRSPRRAAEPATSESPARPAFALAGVALGFLLAAPLALVSEAPPGLEVQWLGLPLAAVTIAVLYPWVDRGELPAALPAVGIAVLLVNLLAAGGIGFPGVAGTLWVLLALGLTQTEPVGPPKAPRIAAVAGLAVAVALAVACYATAYRPVLESQAALRAAERSTARREAFLYAAASADPLSAEPWARLAALAFERWQLDPARANLERFDQAMANALRLSPQSSALWLAAGSRYLEAADRPGVEESLRSEAMGKAVTACRRAVELYPNSGLGRATLALALDAAGDQEGFHQQAEAALRLDALTPHADRKLPDELRNRLLRKNSRRRIGP
jgi:tetratricopeptide (TPR) repeat protein